MIFIMWILLFIVVLHDHFYTTVVLRCKRSLKLYVKKGCSKHCTVVIKKCSHMNFFG